MKQRPLIIAHRGAPREAPENTIPAIQRALEHGADGVEIDVLLTADNVPVLSHNDELSLLTPLRGKIRHLSFAALQAKTAIPTLRDVLELLAKTQVQVMLDMKVQRGALDETCTALLKLLEECSFGERLFLASASMAFLLEMQRRAPHLKRALTIEGRYRPFLQQIFYPKLTIDIASAAHRLITPHFVKTVRQRGQKLLAWTVNDREDILRCAELGVDAIITDDVPFVKRVLS